MDESCLLTSTSNNLSNYLDTEKDEFEINDIDLLKTEETKKFKLNFFKNTQTNSSKSLANSIDNNIDTFDMTKNYSFEKSQITSDVDECWQRRTRRDHDDRHGHEVIVAWIPLIQICAGITLLALSMLIIFGGRLYGFYGIQKTVKRSLESLAPASILITTSRSASKKLGIGQLSDHALSCTQTCKMELVESIPQNLTFASHINSLSTFNAWLRLIDSAKHTLTIAAYKSSLRGKHVFGNTEQHFSHEGEAIYEALFRAGLRRQVRVRILENGPSKDKGDNEDAIQLKTLGAVKRRQLNLQNLYGSGVMHSKFIIADEKDFYLGSANLDWRSLNQKMEMGVLVKDCAHLAQDLNSLFELYWSLAATKNGSDAAEIIKQQKEVRYNAANLIRTRIFNSNADVYLASSPRPMNAPGRSWDLDAIISAINAAQTYLYIHVMDYFPLFIYSKQKRFWPAIDSAIRGAIMRGVRVKMLTAALHYPNVGMSFLESLDTLNSVPGTGRIEIKIFKVPSSPHLQSVVKRDRRTHKKFLVTDNTVIIGTSNWSGDYFADYTTGTAIIIHQNATTVGLAAITNRMREIFERDWQSAYAHSLRKYVDGCLHNANAAAVPRHEGDTFVANPILLPDYCEPAKDKSLYLKAPI